MAAWYSHPRTCLKCRDRGEDMTDTVCVLNEAGPEEVL